MSKCRILKTISLGKPLYVIQQRHFLLYMFMNIGMILMTTLKLM